MATCPACGKGRLRRGKAREEMFGVDLGEYPAEICDSCGESFVDQQAMKKIEEEGQVSVPRHLQDGNRDTAATGQGRDYVYPHEEEGHFTPQQYLPKRLLGTYFYKPSQEGYESQVTARLEMWREAQRKTLGIERREDVPDMSEEEIKEMKRKIK